MTTLHRRLPLLLAGWLAAGAAAAQSPPIAAAPPVAAASAAARDATMPTVTVIEDEGSRIVETRLRGQPQRITVHSKVGNVGPYEIIVEPGGRDTSQERGTTGRRAWSLFDF